ncbi:MAG: ATP-binding cassette domain-containing protein [Desulfobacterales bacterium]
MLYNNADVFGFDKKKLAVFETGPWGLCFSFIICWRNFQPWRTCSCPGLIKGLKSGDIRERAEAILLRVGLADRMTHRVSDLSGGEQQRVALARALVMNPSVLFWRMNPQGIWTRKTAARCMICCFR